MVTQIVIRLEVVLIMTSRISSTKYSNYSYNKYNC
nr:MAG TPA: hypothetical protein [Caudoviricetes sp.]